MARTWVVTKTETILYSKEYYEDELIKMGVDPEVFTDGDTRVDLEHKLNFDYKLRAVVEEDIDRHGDVQGSEFRAKQEER